MAIFTGIEILFFVLGALSVLLICGLVYLRQKYALDWKGLTLGGLGAFLIVFTVAWSVASVLEGEPQAANMGVLVFGTPVLVIFGLMRRMIKAQANA